MSHSRSPGCVGCLLAVPLHSIIESLRTQRPLGPQEARSVWRVFSPVSPHHSHVVEVSGPVRLQSAKPRRANPNAAAL
ncbi:unnamed protein product [Boreogadus saida]